MLIIFKMDLSHSKNYKNNPTYMYGELLFRDIKIQDEEVIEAMTSSLNNYVDFMSERNENDGKWRV